MVLSDYEFSTVWPLSLRYLQLLLHRVLCRNESVANGVLGNLQHLCRCTRGYAQASRERVFVQVTPGAFISSSIIAFG